MGNRRPRGTVVTLPVAFREAPPIEEAPKPDCRHEHIELDPTERIVTCRDCHARIDPYDALTTMARTWRRWEREYEQLTKAREDWADVERTKWHRARDRHLNAHPSHRAAFDVSKQDWREVRDRCRTCANLVFGWNSRWGEPTPFEPLRAPAEAAT